MPATADKPRWTTLAWLTAWVLGLHLLLLGQGSPLAASPLPWTAPHHADATPDTRSRPWPPAQTAPAAGPVHAPFTEASAPQRARISTVRWIPHSSAPATAPAPASSAPQPAPHSAPVRPRSAAARPHSGSAALAQPGPAADPPTPPTDAAPDTPPPSPQALAPDDATPSAAPEGLLLALAPSAETSSAASTAPPRGEARALPPALPPASTQLRYDVNGTAKGLNYRASSALDWTQADGRYSARMEVRILLLGSRVQTSTGRVGASGLLPERFSDKTRSERAAHFDRAQQTIRFSNNQPDAVLQPGAQDRLSLFMQLAGLLQAQASAYPVGHVISLQVAGTGDAEVWRFRVGPEETLTLPAGTLRARRLMREPREPHDSQIDLWLAPELGHLPVRIRITQDNGDRVDQQLSQRP